MNLHPDHILIENLRKADKKAFHSIYTSYYGTICSFANKYMKDQDASEDIAQETFLALWHNIPQIQNESHLKSFLYRTAKNKCLNILKHEQIKDKHSENYKEAIEENFFEEQLIHSEVIGLLKNAIDKLPPKRQKIISRSMQGIQNQEIADEMGISVNTVKLQKKLAYEFLRKRLKDFIFLLFL